ncbi:hypothetical protein BD626DRAFT_390775 [Schizophyllum amplum]|uniref:Bms1-type G domain-containing protein n=1 Tax=Schizophyllum amplum TaxID=97359 RepID=A0A550CZC8_9AGAR|nr:hypothetical protein BD626DRAFT_390775 [Auriculariopsis ampla]
MVEAHHHRASLKQQNKKFKSKHATKSSLKEAAKGRVQRQSPKAPPTNNSAQLRANRRNNAKQAQAKKREAIVSATRLFSGVDGAPRIVAVIPLTDDVSAKGAVSALASSLDASADDCPDTGLWGMRADRFKTSLQFVNVPYGDLYGALDAAKAADYTLLVLSSTQEVNAWGDTLLRVLQAQGIPDAVPVLAADSTLDAKARSSVLKSLLSFVRYFAPAASRIFDLHAASDALSALRAVAEGVPDGVRWRTGRPWVLGEEVHYVEGVDGSEGELAVTGVVRGAPLSTNRLIHVPDFGDFQVARIMSAPRPRGGMEVEPTLLAEPDADDAESLVSSNDPDDMANEQTWPTEEEMSGAARVEEVGQDEEAPKKKRRKLPKGTSEYQASWIIDDDDEEGADDGEEKDDEDEDAADDTMEVEEHEASEGEYEDEMDLDSRKSVAFEELDAEEEEKQLASWRSRDREEEDDAAFPDEVDTPRDVPARTRFQRYRGLRSFRTSPWDPYENLPRDYARIFQFDDFKRVERNVKRRTETETSGVQPGTRVTVYLRNVPREAAARAPLTIFGLLQYEHKKTVLNFSVQRNTEYDGSVRSKDPLILCVGPRRLRVNPIYSQLTRGGGKGANNVHKFERYLRHGNTTIATIFGPVTFGAQPCLLLRETADVQAPHLVAAGTFTNTDTTRVVAKRIILSGHPLKVHKKTATIRYMFFNADDIRYFKPIQLHTKHGRVGHIKESLGTHGYFKAYFDGPITQMDTVCMSLYKRVFPRWATTWKPEEGKGAEGGKVTAGDAMEE